MGNPKYRARIEERRKEQKLHDAILVVDAFEKFIEAKVNDKVLNDIESHIELDTVRRGLIQFLCQQSTKG